MPEVRVREYYKPQAKQQECHNAILNRKENGYRDFLFGGAARGGKSYMMRHHLHLECLSHPGLRVLLVRGSFQELKKSHYAEIRSDLPKNLARFYENYNEYRYANGSVLFFGYGSKLSDFEQYLSAGFDVIAIDEVTTIPWDFSWKLRSRLTANVPNFIPYFMTASNPGGIAATDVKRYFIKKSVDSDKYPQYKPEEVCFIPFTVLDNPKLIERDPDVLKRLQQLPERDRQKYLLGNWDYGDDQFFNEYQENIHVIKRENYLPYERILRFTCCGAMDYGNENYVYFGYKDYEGRIFITDEWEMNRTMKEPATRDRKIASLKAWLKERHFLGLPLYGDTNLWLPDGFDKQKTNTPAYEFIEAGINLVKVSKKAVDNKNYRVVANETIRNLLHWEQDEKGEFTVRPRLYIYERCHKLREILPSLVVDEKNPDDIADGQFDHPFDGAKMLITSIGTSIAQRPETRDELIMRMFAPPKEHETTTFMST